MLLKCNDWEEFGKLFPEASAWMTRRQLVNEREMLKAEVASGRLQMNPRRKVWVEQRLVELDAWHEENLDYL